MNEAQFGVLSMCDGNTDFDAAYMLPMHREIALELLKNSAIVACAKGAKLNAEQTYKLHKCRYMNKIHWSVTGKCNYRCKHCFLSAPNAKYGELTFAQCAEIIDQMSACGIMNVSLTGGECLVRDDFMQIVDLLSEKQIRISQIYSNGFLVNEKLLDALLSRNLRPEFSMSYDGLGWHDWMRGIHGAEAAVEAAFKLCRDKGFSTSAEMCIHRQNKHLLRESVNALADWGCGSVKMNPVSDSELWEKYEDDYSLSNAEVYECYLNYIPAYIEDGAPLTLQLGGFFYASKGGKTYTIPAAKLNGTKDMEQICVCSHARNTMYIAADGKMLPCIPLSGMDIQEDFPNVLEIGLKAGLTDSNYMAVIDLRLSDYLAHNKNCSKCEYKYICGGGCRASALAGSGEYLGPDPATCEIFKGGYPDKIKMAVDSARVRLV